MNGFETVEALSHENEIRMQSRDHFQAGADAAPDLGFFLGVRGVIAVVGVPDETIL